MEFRIFYFISLLCTFGGGLLSRVKSLHFPGWVSLYAGDALWAMMIFWQASFLFPFYPMRARGLCALCFCYLIELSQLYQASWIDTLRNTTLGALVLGQGFLWSDLFCYTSGIFLSLLIEGRFMTRDCFSKFISDK